MTTIRYDLRNIRTLFIEGFSVEELRQLIFDVPIFRSVFNQLAENTGKTQIIQQLLEYADQKELIETLLEQAKERNPAKYEIHKPYYEVSTSPIIPKDVHEITPAPTPISSSAPEKSQRAEITADLAASANTSRSPQDTRRYTQRTGLRWDVFISHASMDKPFVSELASALSQRGLRVWYDDFTLRVGDNLTRSIDRGLANSKYGVVILSPNFFAREWPQRELDALAVRERTGQKVILPVWHNITEAELRGCSINLADRMGVSSSRGLEHVITELLHAMDTENPKHISQILKDKFIGVIVVFLMFGGLGYALYDGAILSTSTPTWTPTNTLGSPTETLLPTPTPMPTNTSIMLTSASTPTPTAIPTPTPIVPTSTSSTTPTPSATSIPTTLPTLTTIPTQTAPNMTTIVNSTLAATLIPAAPAGQFVLVKPNENETFSKDVTFEWQWNGLLDSNQGFEVRVWHEGEMHLGAHDAVKDHQEGQVKKLDNNTYQLVIGDIRSAAGVKGGNGLYQWTVALVEISPYSDLDYEATPHTICIERCGNQSDSGGGGGGGGGPGYD